MYSRIEAEKGQKCMEGDRQVQRSDGRVGAGGLRGAANARPLLVQGSDGRVGAGGLRGAIVTVI